MGLRVGSIGRGLGALVLAGAVLAAAIGARQAGAAEDPVATAPGRTLHGDPDAPDISGIWLGTYTSTPGYIPYVPVEQVTKTHWYPWPAPLTPAYRKEADAITAATVAGRATGDIGAKCLPFGMPMVMVLGAYQNEIIQTPGETSIWVFGSFPVVIWTDGRPHPADLQPSYNGHSTGYWQGDTLYVDTVGILSGTAIEAGTRTPHSDKLHIKWSIQRLTDDTMHVHLIMFDPVAFTEPMVTTNLWHRKVGPDWQLLDDGSCFENNRNAPDAGGVTGFKAF